MMGLDIIGAGGGLFVGLILAWVIDAMEKHQALRKARLEGDELLHKAEEVEERLLEQALKTFKEYQKNIKENFDSIVEKTATRLSELQSKTDRETYEVSLKKKEYQKNLGKITIESQNLRAQNQALEKDISGIINKLEEIRKQLLKKALSRFSIDLSKIKQSIKERVLKTCTDQIKKWETDQIQNLEKNALFYLHCALNRFSVPYCPEKGIETVSFMSRKQLRNTIGSDKQHLNKLEAECGVDVVVHEEDLYIYILGIDPVRRELGRATLKKLSQMRFINDNTIKSLAKKSKKELFERIKKDGRSLCHRLGLKDTAKEVQNMMGSLRYRYSFAQNQHFHCEEVGWLCGLLSSEINLPLMDGRKAGLFHDIGKAMDHSIEGNHAVIGANFIEKHGEAENIVHAVKAHHHDVSPATPLAFLVIAADAISGSRPGARRFTEDSYAKKLAQLEEIADSFENIKDAYIMSAGRELRIIVDNEHVNDKEALVLSQQVARKIERECSYAGLIKVTVVRHSEVVTSVQ